MSKELKIGEVDYGNLKFKYRVESTDWGIIQEACGGLNTKFFDVEEGEHWLDIGSHIGSFTCYALSKGAYVEAFEPFYENYNLLVENVTLNDFQDKAILKNYGVTSDGRDIKLYIDRSNFGNCSVYKRYENVDECLLLPTVSSFSFRSYDNYSLKVDTEGCEYEILSSIDLTKVDKLVMENHYWLISKKEQEDLLNLVQESFPNFELYKGYMVYGWK